MTEFEKWLESGEYKRDTENYKIDISVEHTDSSYKIEFKNILEFAEVCFNKGLDIGFDKGKISHSCSLVNCDGRENGIQLRKAKTIIKELCDCVRALNNSNTQLTDVDGFLKEFEEFTE